MEGEQRRSKLEEEGGGMQWMKKAAINIFVDVGTVLTDFPNCIVTI